MQVYVTGRVLESRNSHPPSGFDSCACTDLAGGTKVLHGKVEFIRFTRRRNGSSPFGLNSDVPSGDYRNPVLMSGDVLRIRETALTKSVAVIDEVTKPIVGVYTLYSIFDNFGN